MRRVIPITEQYQYFVAELQGSFWGDCYGQARRFVHEAIERESLCLREVYLHCRPHERTAERRDQRNGFYRDFQTRFGCLRLKIARSRTRSFLPSVIQLFQRRSEDVTLLVREAFLRGISTRQVGRVISCLQLGPLSAQTVSRLSRSLDSWVAAFHQCPIADAWAYLFLDGVSLRVRRPARRKRVQMLVAYGVRRDGSRQLLAFLRSQGESQAAWEGLLQDLYRRGLLEPESPSSSQRRPPRPTQSTPPGSPFRRPAPLGNRLSLTLLESALTKVHESKGLKVL